MTEQNSNLKPVIGEKYIPNPDSIVGKIQAIVQEGNICPVHKDVCKMETCVVGSNCLAASGDGLVKNIPDRNREIKFRAWCPQNNEMYYSTADYSFHISEGYIYLTAYPDSGLDHFSTEENNPSYKHIKGMEYIGLKDRNGTDIYEGDWCEAQFRDKEGIHTIQGHIVMDECMWCLNASHTHDIYSVNRLYGFEVIGNIYKNPELVQQL